MSVKCVDFVLLKVGVPVLVSFGLLGNFASVFVFCQKVIRSPFTFLLIGLGLSDSLFLIGRFFIFGNYIIPPYWLFAISFIAQTCSSYFTIAISWERYIAICHPIKSYQSLTIHKAKWLSLFVVLLSSVINIPEIFYTVHGLNSIWFIIYLCWEAILKVVIPLLLLLWLNLTIYLRIRLCESERSELGINQLGNVEKSKGKILLAVVLMFAFCYVPFIFYLADEFYHRIGSLSSDSSELELDDKNVTETVTIRTTVADSFSSYFWIWLKFTTTLNSSVNFVIYYFMGKKFRDIFLANVKRLFRIPVKDRRESNQSKSIPK